MLKSNRVIHLKCLFFQPLKLYCSHNPGEYQPKPKKSTKVNDSNNKHKINNQPTDDPNFFIISLFFKKVNNSLVNKFSFHTMRQMSGIIHTKKLTVQYSPDPFISIIWKGFILFPPNHKNWFI